MDKDHLFSSTQNDLASNPTYPLYTFSNPNFDLLENYYQMHMKNVESAPMIPANDLKYSFCRYMEHVYTITEVQREEELSQFTTFKKRENQPIVVYSSESHSKHIDPKPHFLDPIPSERHSFQQMIQNSKVFQQFRFTMMRIMQNEEIELKDLQVLSKQQLEMLQKILFVKFREMVQIL